MVRCEILFTFELSVWFENTIFSYWIPVCLKTWLFILCRFPVVWHTANSVICTELNRRSVLAGHEWTSHDRVAVASVQDSYEITDCPAGQKFRSFLSNLDELFHPLRPFVSEIRDDIIHFFYSSSFIRPHYARDNGARKWKGIRDREKVELKPYRIGGVELNECFSDRCKYLHWLFSVVNPSAFG